MAVYCGECDGEWSVFADEADHDAQDESARFHELKDAELVFSLGGHRGHYLARDFAYEALALIGNPNTADDVAILDAYEEDRAVTLEDGSTLRPEDIGQTVSEIADDYERALGDLGYVVEWNDGVTVYRIGDVVREGEG